MAIIQKLTQDVITKIAAGEVIQRPASVVKELVENSIDAEATHIHIHITGGGLTSIEVTDNGIGMDAHDMQQCFLPHTTSKLQSIDDLGHIHSLGFRGEALASMVEVAEVHIASRAHGATAGNVADIWHGEVQQMHPKGMPVGTRIRVQHLFGNMPARKQFLKSETTEVRLVTQVIMQCVLGFSEIGFTLLHNGKRILHVLAQHTLERRLPLFFGSLAKELVPLTHTAETLSVGGYIGKPQSARRTLSNQLVFVNNRCVRSTDISQTIKQAYGSLLDARSHPPFVLYLTMPTELVDANIHPQKEEVRFVGTDHIRATVHQSVEKVLEQESLTYTDPIHVADMIRDTGADQYMSNILKDVAPWSVYGEVTHTIAQIHNTYLITQTKKGVLLVDQHAAHERILYEQFSKAFREHALHTQTFALSEPVVIDLSLQYLTLLEQYSNALQQAGFAWGVLGGNTIHVTHMPVLFKERDPRVILTEILDDMDTGHGSFDSVTERTLAYIACRGAIKAGDPLTQDERKKLLEKLHHTKTQYTCPHGRPVMIELSVYELERMFKRK